MQIYTFLRFLNLPILHLFEIFCKHCVLGMVAAGCLRAVAGSGLARFPWPWETNGRGGRNGEDGYGGGQGAAAGEGLVRKVGGERDVS